MGAEVGHHRHVNQPERKKRGKELSVCSGMSRRERAPEAVVAARRLPSRLSDHFLLQVPLARLPSCSLMSFSSPKYKFIGVDLKEKIPIADFVLRSP